VEDRGRGGQGGFNGPRGPEGGCYTCGGPHWKKPCAKWHKSDEAVSPLSLVFIGSAVSGAATEPNRPPNIQGHRGGSKVLAGASAEEVLKLEIVRDVDPGLGAFEEAPHSQSQLYHLTSTSEVGLAPPFLLALPHPEHQDAQWPVGSFWRPLTTSSPAPVMRYERIHQLLGSSKFRFGHPRVLLFHPIVPLTANH